MVCAGRGGGGVVPQRSAPFNILENIVWMAKNTCSLGVNSGRGRDAVVLPLLSAQEGPGLANHAWGTGSLLPKSQCSGVGLPLVCGSHPRPCPSPSVLGRWKGWCCFSSALRGWRHWCKACCSCPPGLAASPALWPCQSRLARGLVGKSRGQPRFKKKNQTKKTKPQNNAWWLPWGSPKNRSGIPATVCTSFVWVQEASHFLFQKRDFHEAARAKSEEKHWLLLIVPWISGYIAIYSRAQRMVVEVVSVPANSRSSAHATRFSSWNVPLPLSFTKRYVSAAQTARAALTPGLLQVNPKDFGRSHWPPAPPSCW